MQNNEIHADSQVEKLGRSAKAKIFFSSQSCQSQDFNNEFTIEPKNMPGNLPISHGCVEQLLIDITCYILKANVPITKSGWYFELDTYLHGHWIDAYDISDSQNLSVSNTNITVIGEIQDQEMKNILGCFTNSAVVKRSLLTC